MPGAQHSACTIEMANLATEYEVAVIDEVQVGRGLGPLMDLQTLLLQAIYQVQSHLQLAAHRAQRAGMGRCWNQGPGYAWLAHVILAVALCNFSPCLTPSVTAPVTG